MTFADWFDDFVEDFVDHMADCFFEYFVLFGAGPFFDRLNRFVQLAIYTQEHLNDVRCCLRVLKQGFSPWKSQYFR
jgi:hypothetical protein